MENAVLPTQGSAGTIGYDLCVANNCVIPSWGKSTIDTGLAGITPSGDLHPDCTTSHGLPSRIFTEIEAGVVDLDYWGDIKVVLFQSLCYKGLRAVQVGDQIAQLILRKNRNLSRSRRLADLDNI